MTLEIRPRPTNALRAVPNTSWPEPPRPPRPAQPVRLGGDPSRVMGEAEWVGAPGRGVAPPARSGAPVLSPGLARLLNAALIDPSFGERFVESPLMAARWVYGGVGAAGGVFGATLPDPALRLTLPALSEPDWSILGHMPRTASVAEAARELRRLAALAALAAAAALGHDEAAAPTELAEPVRLPLGGHGAYRTPASHEGALAGAA